MNQIETGWSDKDVSDAWDSRAYKYGIGENEELIMGIIDKLHPSAVFEVGIGNGWPFAKHFCEKGMTVGGCDVSEYIVAKAKEGLNAIGGGSVDEIYVGDLRGLKITRKYDLTYCVRVSWCLKEKDFLKILDKMAEITRPGGYVVFDIFTKRSWLYIKSRFIYIYAFAVQIVRWFVKRKFNYGPLNYFFNMKRVDKHLREKGIKYKKYCEEHSVGKPWEKNDRTHKVLYVCKL